MTLQELTLKLAEREERGGSGEGQGGGAGVIGGAESQNLGCLFAHFGHSPLFNFVTAMIGLGSDSEALARTNNSILF